MSITSCPHCAKQVTLPMGVGSDTRVRCPLCRAQYTLADALVNMPPILEVVDDRYDVGGDDSLGFAREPATNSAQEALQSTAEPASEAPAELPAEFFEEPSSSTDSTSGAEASASVESSEELSFEEFAAEPAEAEAPGEPPQELRFEDFETEHDEVTAQDLDTEVEDVTFRAADPLVREVPEEGEPIELAGPDDESALDFGAPEAPRLDEPEFAAADEEITLDFEQSQPAAASGSEDALDFGEPTEAHAGGDEIELDFGEPVGAAETSAVAAEQQPAAPEGKKKKEKKKKSREPKAPGAPRKRSLVGVLANVTAALVAVPVALYIGIWVGPDYDFLNLGPKLPRALRPAAFNSKLQGQLAQMPTQSPPVLPGALMRGGQGDGNPGQPVPASEPEAAGSPPGETTASETPPAPAAEEPAISAPTEAAPPKPEDSAPPPPDAAEPAQQEAPPEPVAETPQNPPPGLAAPGDDKPQEAMPDDAAPPKSAPEKAATSEDDLPAAPTELTAPSDDVAELLESPAEKKPAEAPDPFAPADDETTPADEAAMPEEAAAPEEELGPHAAHEFTSTELSEAVGQTAKAVENMTAALAAPDKAEVKKARAGLFLSMYGMADVLTFAKDKEDEAGLEAERQNLEQLVLAFVSDQDRLKEARSYGAKWLGFSKRTTPGVVLAGTVESVEQVGKLYQIKLKMTGDAPAAMVVCKTDPELKEADEAMTLGTIVERPADELAGYEGDAAQVVWSGMTIKLPAK